MRFKEIVSTQKIIDTEKDIEYDGLVDTEVINILNKQDMMIKQLVKDRNSWKDDALHYTNIMSIFSREISVLQDTGDINRFVEIYYEYCIDRANELKEKLEKGVE